MKILLLEPHGDDALLSCHSLLDTDNEISIVTFSDHDSDKLPNHFKSIVSTEFCNFPNLWYPDGKPILKTHQVHRDYKDGLPIADNYLSVIKEVFKDRWNEAVGKISDAILEIMLCEDFDVVVCPTGVVHPYHLAVREAWRYVKRDSRLEDIPTLYYADKYYIQNRYAKEMYEDIRIRYNIEHEINPGYIRLDEENRRIADILWDCYPTEGKLLRFYSDIILWYPCKYMYHTNNTIERLVKEIDG